MKRLAAFVRETWDGQASARRELQETRLQLEQQREYTAYLIRTAPAVKARILERWAKAHLEQCERKWAAIKPQRRIAPVPMRRERA